MKVLYSQLKKYLPELKASVQEIANVYTKTGFMLDKLIEVEYNQKKDYLLDLEVRQNRADAFGVRGLARELSAYFNIPLVVPVVEVDYPIVDYRLPIEVRSIENVKRVMAIKIDNLVVKESPIWLKEYLKFYDVNSINNLVDLTNYIMIETGHASHAFDTVMLEGDKLIWEMAENYKTIVSLNGEELNLNKHNLVISNGKEPLALSFIGGKKDAINNNTLSAIIEMASYNPAIVRQNSRKLNIVTEAGSRLEKFMDPDSIPKAFDNLISLILEYCGGKITSEIYDNYLQPTLNIDIIVNLDKVQQVAGIPISYAESIRFLKGLGFLIKKEIIDTSVVIIVERPIDRIDIQIEEDVIEEIVRLKGYNLIQEFGQNHPLYSQVVKDITSKNIILQDKIYDILSNNGFDEVRSWILVESKKNTQANWVDWNEIALTNSINEEVPFLRQSLTINLLNQLEIYLKNNVQDISIFEIGKVFGQKDNKYFEEDHVGLLKSGKSEKEITFLKSVIEILLRTLGYNNILFEKNINPPITSHPQTCWDIVLVINNLKYKVGIIYLTNNTIYQNAIVSEIKLDNLVQMQNEVVNRVVAKEINQKLVNLDVNINLNSNQNINEIVIEKLKDLDNVWSWEIIDIFKMSENKIQPSLSSDMQQMELIKYTLRVSYIDLKDKEAKALHDKIFNNKV